MRKGQNSTEFVILAGFMMFIFLIFFIIIQQKLVSANDEKNDAAASQVMDIVVNELKNAESVSDGYYRTFLLPQNVNGLQYNIDIVQGVGGTSEVVISYNGKEKVYFLEQYIDSASSINKGLNRVSKINGDILVMNVTGKS